MANRIKPRSLRVFFSCLALFCGAKGLAGQAAPAAKAVSYEAAAAALRSAPPQELARLLSAQAASLSPREGARLLSEFAPRLEGSDRRRAFRESGELYLLLGAYGEAAASLESAGRAEPRDPSILLKAARACLAAGESGRAGELASLVMAAGGDEALQAAARMAAAWSALLAGDAATARSLATLSAQAESPAGAKSQPAGPPRPEIRAGNREALFLLWVSGDEAQKKEALARLKAEHAGSLEAELADRKAGLSLAPLPHWYLGMLGSLESRAAKTVPSSGSAPSSASGAPPKAAASKDAGAKETTGAGPSDAEAGRSGEAPSRFQIGIFTRRENAEHLAAELRKKGLASRLDEKTVSGKLLIAVTVDAGSDSNATLTRLKDLGYEAYPIFP